jgi:lipoprotein signal peptidase
VTDFIDVGPWPNFNLADSSIVVGVAIIIGFFLLTESRQQHAQGP